jgi:hypothetical protein
MLVQAPRSNACRAFHRAMTIAAALLCLAGTPGAMQPVQAAQDHPEHAIRPLRALLAIAEETVKPRSSCDQGRLIATKPGPQQMT